MLKKLTIGIVLSVSISGCSLLYNDANDALTTAERHPITVDQQTVTLEIPVDQTLSGLSRGSLAELDAFLTEYRTRGHGPMTVTAPSGGPSDRDAQEAAANIRQALNAFGLAYSEMQGATYRRGAGNDGVIVSFTRYAASGPVCGVFSGEVKARLKSVRAPNFGCADQANLAAMVADPADLARMQPNAPSNGSQAATAVQFLHSGLPAGTPPLGGAGGAAGGAAGGGAGGAGAAGGAGGGGGMGGGL